jgi:hypothetical protein
MPVSVPDKKKCGEQRIAFLARINVIEIGRQVRRV